MPDRSRPPTDLELVDLVLDRLPPARREALRRQAAREASLGRRIDLIRAHLKRYDTWTAPPPPPFRAVERVLPPQAGKPVQPRLRPATIALGLAALLLVGIGLGRLVSRDAPSAPPLEARARGSTLRAGDVVKTTTAPEAIEIGDVVRLVLDGDSALRYLGPGRVHLDRGRVYAEVQRPHPFAVVTEAGTAEVLGTVFEVALDGGGDDDLDVPALDIPALDVPVLDVPVLDVPVLDVPVLDVPVLDVTVFEGRVRVGDVVVEAGSRLGRRGLETHDRHPGRWFRTPRLRIEARSPGRLADGLDLVLVLEPPGTLPVQVGGPPDVRRALWIEVRDPAGGVHDLTPSLDGPPFGLARGEVRVLRPGETLRQHVHLAAPGRTPGSYRCRAMYRPEHEAPAISAEVEVELPE